MAQVVTSYQWAWKRAGGAGYDGDAGVDVMNWVGEMSEKGWELKGFTSYIHPETQHNAAGGKVDIWAAYYSAVMQRPIQIANSDDGWEYPG